MQVVTWKISTNNLKLWRGKLGLSGWEVPTAPTFSMKPRLYTLVYNAHVHVHVLYDNHYTCGCT